MCTIRRREKKKSSSILITALFLLVTLIECRSFNTSPLLLTTSSSSSSSSSFEVWNRIHRGGDLTTRTPSSSSSALGAGAAIGSAAASPVIVHALGTFMKQNPFAAAFGISSLNASFADYIAQKRSQLLSSNINNDNNKTKFDMKRNTAFFLYGGFFQGMVFEYLFNTYYPRLFGTGTDILTVFKKVTFDLFVCTPFLCLPLAYLTKGLVYGTSIQESLGQYKYDVLVKKLLHKSWALWGIVHSLTFSVVPNHLRISFVTGVNLCWMIILSSIAGGTDDDSKANNNASVVSNGDEEVMTVDTSLVVSSQPMMLNKEKKETGKKDKGKTSR